MAGEAPWRDERGAERVLCRQDEQGSSRRIGGRPLNQLGSDQSSSKEVRVHPLQLVDRHRRDADTMRDHQPRQLGAVDEDGPCLDALGVLTRIGAEEDDG